MGDPAGPPRGEPVLQPDLLRRRSFAAGMLLALFYFAGFTSLFFILSILWQAGLRRSALDTGLLVVPFALAFLVSAASSSHFSARFGRNTILAGIAAMFAGQAAMLAVRHLAAPYPGQLYLLGPLVLAGLGNGLVIAPNQDSSWARCPSGRPGPRCSGRGRAGDPAPPSRTWSAPPS